VWEDNPNAAGRRAMEEEVTVGEYPPPMASRPLGSAAHPDNARTSSAASPPSVPETASYSDAELRALIEEGAAEHFDSDGTMRLP